MTPAEKAAKRKEIRDRIKHRISDLEKKREVSGLTEKETLQLKRLRQLHKRFAPLERIPHENSSPPKNGSSEKEKHRSDK